MVLSDPKAEKLGLVRVIDESSEPYLYSRSQFGEIELPRALARAFAT